MLYCTDLEVCSQIRADLVTALGVLAPLGFSGPALHAVCSLCIDGSAHLGSMPVTPRIVRNAGGKSLVAML